VGRLACQKESPVNGVTPSSIALEPRFITGESPFKGVTLAARRAKSLLNGFSSPCLTQFVSNGRLALLVLTSVEYRFDWGSIKLPVDAIRNTSFILG